MLNEKYSEGHKKGYDSGYEKGYGSGMHEGLTSEKKGVICNANGMYAFEGDTFLHDERITILSGYNPIKKETTVYKTLSDKDEPCGIDTGYKYNYKLKVK